MLLKWLEAFIQWLMFSPCVLVMKVTYTCTVWRNWSKYYEHVWEKKWSNEFAHFVICWCSWFLLSSRHYVLNVFCLMCLYSLSLLNPIFIATCMGLLYEILKCFYIQLFKSNCDNYWMNMSGHCLSSMF